VYFNPNVQALFLTRTLFSNTLRSVFLFIKSTLLCELYYKVQVKNNIILILFSLPINKGAANLSV